MSIKTSGHISEEKDSMKSQNLGRNHEISWTLSIFDFDTRSFWKYTFLFHLCLNCGLLGQTKPFVNGKEMSIYSLCKILSRGLRKGRVHYVNENIRIYIANSCNGEEPRMIKTLAAKSFSSESELWSTSQQCLNLEIYLTSCFFYPCPSTTCQNQTTSAICLIRQNDGAWKCRQGCLLYF